jgi:hypothetical protein
MSKFKLYLIIFLLPVYSYAAISNENVYTLYRNSVTDVNMRIHVATFDAAEAMEYNRDNCAQAQLLFQNQQGVKTKFWCEMGHFRK